MALPTETPAPAQNPDYKARNFMDMDSLLSELSTERQNFDAPAPPPGSTPPPMPGIPPAPGAQPLYPGELPAEPITREDAERAGKRMATMLDGALSFTGMIIAKEQTTEKYKASEGELKDLAEACSEVSEQYQFKVNPWFNVAILLLFIYMPKLIQANNDRRIKALETKAREQEARIQAIEDKNKKESAA